MYKESTLFDKIFDVVFIDPKNPNQLKVKRKGKATLVNIRESHEGKSFKDYLVSMTKSIDNTNYDSINETDTQQVDLSDIHVTNIPDRFNQAIVSIFKDASVVHILDSKDYKRQAIQSYEKNS